MWRMCFRPAGREKQARGRPCAGARESACRLPGAGPPQGPTRTGAHAMSAAALRMPRARPGAPARCAAPPGRPGSPPGRSMGS